MTPTGSRADAPQGVGALIRAAPASHLGPYNAFVPGAVQELEREFAGRLGAVGAVAAGFGRSALTLALEALEVRGSDVLVPNFICAQVVEAVRCAGGHPVFYPVRRVLTVDATAFEAAFTCNTRAAIAAHYFGRLLGEMERLAGICRTRHVALIEDCALVLEASLEARPGGGSNDLAVFSFTKSGWCYGGGMVASNSPELLARLRALRMKTLTPCGALMFRYGLLRCADFASNRPSRSRLAERAGRWLERLSGLRGGNFYDTGRFDAALSEFAARHAHRMLAQLSAATARLKQILARLTEALRDTGQALLRPQLEPGDAGSFLLVQCPDGRAEDWVEEAARHGVTLRRCWPAYQPVEAAQASYDLDWLAEHLLVLEIHPQLSPGEVETIAHTLRRLAGSVQMAAG